MNVRSLPITGESTRALKYPKSVYTQTHTVSLVHASKIHMGTQTAFTPIRPTLETSGALLQIGQRLYKFCAHFLLVLLRRSPYPACTPAHLSLFPLSIGQSRPPTLLPPMIKIPSRIRVPPPRTPVHRDAGIAGVASAQTERIRRGIPIHRKARSHGRQAGS